MQVLYLAAAHMTQSLIKSPRCSFQPSQGPLWSYISKTDVLLIFFFSPILSWKMFRKIGSSQYLGLGNFATWLACLPNVYHIWQYFTFMWWPLPMKDFIAAYERSEVRKVGWNVTDRHLMEENKNNTWVLFGDLSLFSINHSYNRITEKCPSYYFFIICFQSGWARENVCILPSFSISYINHICLAFHGYKMFLIQHILHLV